MKTCPFKVEETTNKIQDGFPRLTFKQTECGDDCALYDHGLRQCSLLTAIMTLKGIDRGVNSL